MTNNYVHTAPHGGSPGELEALNATTGALLWKVEANKIFDPEAITVSGHVAYVLSLNPVPEKRTSQTPGKMISAVDVQHGTILWSQTIISNEPAALFFANGMIIVSESNINRHDNITNYQFHICALQASNGVQIWCTPYGVPPADGGDALPFVVTGTTLYVGYPVSNSGRVNALVAYHVLEAYNLSNGNKLWSKRFAAISPSVLLAEANGNIYIATDSTLYALSSTKGQVLWQVPQWS